MSIKFKILFIMVLASATSVAQTISVEVRPPVVIEGETFSVIYTLSDTRATDIRVDEIEGCNRLRENPGVTTSSSTTIINGKMTQNSSYAYAYPYRALTVGTHAIPPAVFTVDGKEIRTNSASIKVLPPDQTPSTTSSGHSSTQQPSQISGQTTASQGAGDSFVRMNLNKTRVSEHEAIECTLTLYTHERQPQLNYKTTPSFDGFLTQDVDGFRGQATMDNVGGRNYYVFPLRRYILFPQKTGRLEVNPGSLTMTVTEYETMQTFFGRQLVPVGEREVTVAGRPTTVEVAPLPSPAPPSFTGAVGRFTLESKLNPESLRTGEAASITVIVTGTGNIANIKCPTPEFPVDFEQYTPSEDVATRVSGSTVTGSITSEYTFVPQSVGSFEIPQLEFTYYDTSSHKYVTLTAGGYTVDVARGTGTPAASSAVEQEDISRRATDILHIHSTDSSVLSKVNSRPILYSAMFWIIWGVILAGGAAFLIVYRRETRKRADIIGLKTARAGRVARKRLRLAKRYMADGNAEAFHAEVLRALWGYISDRLAIPVSDLSRANISDRLSGHGLTDDEIRRLIDILDECEMARYTPASAMRPMQQIYADASDAMDVLSKVKPLKR